MKEKKKRKNFIATSKLIGLIIAILTVIVLVYTLIVMFNFKDLEPLPTVIVGILGLASTYVGFYISMAKAEHIEDKRNELQREINEMYADGIITEEEAEREGVLKEKIAIIEEQLDGIKQMEE